MLYVVGDNWRGKAVVKTPRRRYDGRISELEAQRLPIVADRQNDITPT